MTKPGDEFTVGGHWDHGYVDADLISAFGGESEGYIMIYSPKYKWFPAKLGRWFPKMMVAEAYPVSVEATNSPDMVMLRREEEE